MKRTTDKKVKNGRWRIWMTIGCAVVFFVLCASYGVRTSVYLEARLTPKLARLGAAMGGSFEFSRVQAQGLTGILLSDVRFRPDMPGVQSIEMGTVTVYPALLGMFVGDLDASRIEIERARAHFWLDSGSPDRKWLDTVRRNLTGGNVAGESDLNAAGEARTLPVLACQDCNFEVDYHGFRAHLSVPYEEARIPSRESGELQLTQQPMDICVQRTDDSQKETCFVARVAGGEFADGLHVTQVNLENLSHGGVEIRALELHNVEIGQNDSRSVFLVERGYCDAHVEEDSILPDLSGEYAFDFAHLEWLYAYESQRLGGGVSLKHGETAARVFGGYDIASRRLALTFDTQAFDFAPFLGKADFAEKLRITSLPLTGLVHTVVDLGAQRATFDLNVAMHGGSLESPILARDPLTDINVSLSMTGGMDVAHHLLSITSASGSMGKIPFEFRLLRDRSSETGRFDASLALHGESADFIESLPKGFAPMLTGYRLSGEFGIQLGLSYDEANLDALVLETDFDLDQVETLAFDPRSNFELLRGDAFMIRIHAATVPIEIGPRDTSWVRFYDLPRHTAYAFVASEDGKFFTHPGFDIRAIRASLIADLKADKIVRGGSTISQQVVKNLFLNHDKTASRKFQEAFLTWQMEKTLPKIRIFEFYLNLAHFAKDIYGVRAAAEYYFKKNMSQLTLRESLFLAAILPNPIIFGGQYIDGKLSSSRLNKMINVGNALKATNRISAEEWEQTMPLIREGKISDSPKPSR